MEKEQRTRLQKATQDARKLLEEEFRSQLLETYDINVAVGRWNEEPGAHLQAEQRLIREKLVAWIEHKEAQISDRKEALLLAQREMAFTALNRFVALKLMEARELVRPCVSGGLESEGFQDFTAVAQGLLADQEAAYRLYLETIFEDVGQEVRVLFDPRDPASALWPRRTALLELLAILNRPELTELWGEDETIGWVYQYFNGDAERKAMREESSAPRNSRELAVRNQFFTPRYVVEFLTDNTLGRLWYEMTCGETVLRDSCLYLVRRPTEIFLQRGESTPESAVSSEAQAGENLSQEELLRQPVHIPHRPLKDPREIRLLDPACGSMHFGLYAFDLFSVIYDEAWEIAHGLDDSAKSAEAFAPFVTFAATFPEKAAFLREVPRLIVELNIHGIDIDPRAVQIAGLSLWLRAQRAWYQAGVSNAARPRINRSNVVCAEPMPGEKELLREFVERQFPTGEQPAFAFLLERIFDSMNLAGEAGSLLRIEEVIRSGIGDARALAQSQSAPRQTRLFPGDERPEQAEFDLGGLNDEQFWQRAEQRIYEALETYAKQAESGGGFQRRLFADDAAQGFAFIDLCRKRYDVVVMNPPFGLSQAELYDYLNREYPDSFIDLLASFIVRGETLAPSGFIGTITSRACLYTKTLLEWRTTHMSGRIAALADLGIGVLDGAMVRACAYVIPVGQPSVNGCFIDARKTDDKASAILRSVQSATTGDAASASLFCCDSAFFALIPQHRILYWLPQNFWKQVRSLPAIEPHAATIRAGLTTYDDVRFLRLRWEISPAETDAGNTWVFLSKGGYFSTFYNDVHLVVLWADGGKEVGAYNRSLYQTDSQSRRGSTFYLRPAVTYSRRTDFFSARALPTNCFFADKGPAIIPLNSTPPTYLLGLFNSDLMRGMVHAQSQGGCFETGVLKLLPWSEPDATARETVESAAKAAWSAKARVFAMFETDARFVSPLLAIAGSIERCQAVTAKAIEQCNADTAANAALITATVSKLFKLNSNSFEDLDVFENDHEIKEAADFLESPVTLATALFSHALGTAFGRLDIRYATGERPAPELPDPFAQLPVCPPGMLQGDDGLPLSPEAGRRLRAEGRYPLDVAWDGILVDDPEHPLDLERRVHAALQVIWSDRADAIQQEACELLGVSKLRDWFRRPTNFFADHLKRYSKSRRQAPIYWQLSVGSSSYSVWLYYHRFTADMLYRVLRDFVEPRLQEAERELFDLEAQGALSGGAADRLKFTQALLPELKLLKAELDLVAPLWNPNLNDGVIINHAILWRITPYTPWQKKCKECWDKLVAGEYEWAHLAFHLWPSRVIPKCTSDRSLAIAHGLEERLWQETNNGNWLPRQVSEAELQALITEHTKPAVQNALERFLAAPPPVAPARTRAPRATRSSSTGTTSRRPRGTATVVDAEASRQTLLVLTAAPEEGLSKNSIADLLDVEAGSLTAVIKQLKEGGQIEQLGAARGAKYRLTEQGRSSVESYAGEDG